MLNHEVFDAIINYYNNSPAKKKVVISFEKDNYVVKVDVAAPSIVLSKDYPDDLMLYALSLFSGSYHIIKNTNNNIVIRKRDPNGALINILNGTHSGDQNTTINPSSVLFNIYTSIYA